MANNINITDLFTKATTITRGSTSTMATGFKVYHDKIAIKHSTLTSGTKVLCKITTDAIIFTPTDKGNRVLTGKGNDGRVMLSLNEQMRRVFNKCFNEHKNGSTCDTLALEVVKDKDTTYYVLSTKAEVVE